MLTPYFRIDFTNFPTEIFMQKTLKKTLIYPAQHVFYTYLYQPCPRGVDRVDQTG